jgi:AraC-like DNA-binding protein
MPNLPRSFEQARVISTFVLPLLERMREAGFTFEQLADSAGLDARMLKDLPEQIRAQDYLALMNAGAKLTDDAFFGLHLGARMFAPAHAAYGMILSSCRTFTEALVQVQRYESLVHDMGRTSLRLDGDSAVISWSSDWPEVNECRHVAECIVASFQTMAAALARMPIPIMEAGLAHAQQDGSEEYERVLRCPIHFDQPSYYGRIAIQVLHWPLPYATTDLLPVLVKHGEQLLLERGKTGKVSELEAAVKDAIISELKYGRSGLTDIAASLDLSVRTLQRRLKEVGLHFRVLLDSTRQELAQHYLRSTKLSLTEIAFLVGFQEQSSFNHAFREWTGTTPTLWRYKNASKEQIS